MMDLKIMRSGIQPNSALPMTRNMPYHTASVPSRNQPRNMTGIYLGLEGNIKPPMNRSIMPFVKPRAGMSSKVRTTAEDRRYKKVELLRIKEEKRGFRGQTVKKHRHQEDSMKENIHPKSGNPRHWGPAKSANPSKFEDIIRQNTRNYTHIINNGITRSENLQGFMSFDEHYSNLYTSELGNMLLPNALIEEVARVSKEREDLLGLEECYKKVCKGNSESLQSLLPLRKGSARSDNYSTGFTVRSYRNPNKAELLADFDVQPMSTHPRPKTVPATHLQRLQPHVPAPYFFKYYNKPLTAGQRLGKSPSSQFEEQMNSGEGGDKIFGASGSGAISRSLRQGRMSAWSEDDMNNRIIKRGTPRTDSPLKDNTESRRIHIPTRNDSVLTNAEPLEIKAEGYQNNTDDKTPLSDRTTNGNPPNTTRSSNQSPVKDGESTEASSPKKSPAKSDRKDSNNKQSDNGGTQQDMMDGRQRDLRDNMIRLDLETEDGKKQEIILDDRESKEKENKKARESEALVASLQADAENRKKELEQILHEHEEIVTALAHQSSEEGDNDDERDP